MNEYSSPLSQLNNFLPNPESIQRLLEERKGFINQNNLLFSPLHPNKSIKTSQGRSPINQLIAELYNDRQLRPLKSNQFLDECASFIAEQYRRQNTDEHTFIQTISKDVRNRLNSHNRYRFDSGVKCLIAIGFKSPCQPLLSLLIDDGDPQRNKRRIILNNRYQYCGVGITSLNDPSIICGVYLLANDILYK